MPRFDVYANPNPRASHARLLDVQSDLVLTSTRWCVPLSMLKPDMPVMSGAQALLVLEEQSWLLDTPNVLAMPAALLRQPQGRLTPEDQLRVETALDFMLRGW